MLTMSTFLLTGVVFNFSRCSPKVSHLNRDFAEDRNTYPKEGIFPALYPVADEPIRLGYSAQCLYVEWVRISRTICGAYRRI